MLPRALLSGGLDLVPLLDRITSSAGENVTLKLYVADKDKRIAELEEKLLSSGEKLAAMPMMLSLLLPPLPRQLVP